ncbi:MAG: hypothetical protein U0871_15105 [Gemmataceae bacterium]
MALTSAIAAISKRIFTTPAVERRPTRLGVEGLEQRDVPTAMFNPALGAEDVFWRANNPAGQPANQAITAPVANNPSILSNPTVYLIFRGTSWTDASAGRMAGLAKSVIEPPYLSALTQYGSDGRATYGGFVIDRTARPVPASPNDIDRDQTIAEVLDNPTVPWMRPAGVVKPAGYQLSPIYVVVYDNGDGYASNGGGNYSAFGSPFTFLTNAIRINNGTNPDQFTTLFSHELVERISDGTGAGIGVRPAGAGQNVDGQLADDEPNGRYYYRLAGGALVQAYWSVVDRAFVVPDGQPDVVLDPLWNGAVFNGNSVSLQDGNLFLIDGTGRRQAIDTRVAAFAKLGNTVYELTDARQVRRYDGTNWVALTGSNTRVESLAATTYNLFMLASNGGPAQVWRYDGNGTNWTALTPAGVATYRIAVAGNELYRIAQDGGVWKYASWGGTQWTAVTPPGSTVYQLVSVGDRLYAWGSMSGSTRVWRYTGSGTAWVSTTGDTTSVFGLEASANALYLLGANSGVGVKQAWRYDGWGTSWTPLTGVNTAVDQIASVGNRLYMAATNTGTANKQVWLYSGAGTNWTPLTPATTAVNYLWVDGAGLYMAASSPGSTAHNWRYAGIPLFWVAIG